MSDGAWWYLAAVCWMGFFAIVIVTRGTASRSQRRARRWLRRNRR